MLKQRTRRAGPGDFLMFAYERRLEEDEMMDDGRMDEYERLSEAEMRRSYAKYLRDLASV